MSLKLSGMSSTPSRCKTFEIFEDAMKELFIYIAFFFGFMSVMNHFTGDHHDCEYYLLSTIAFALLAIAAKKD